MCELDLNLDFDNDVREEVWKTLVQQIIKGNVIPVIGNEMVKVDKVSSFHYLLNVMANRVYNVQGNVSSFTSLINHIPALEANKLHQKVAYLIKNNDDKFVPTQLLKDFLSIKYFPFVLTTTVDPIIEKTMKEIHGDKLRVLKFCNNSGKNEDIKSSIDVKEPTLYYMFGKANINGDDFVLSDSDLLQFSRCWLQRTDSADKSKPANLSNALSKKFLLVLGSNFQDWLFRFFWFCMKDNVDNKGEIPNGLMASENSDEKLIEFLTYSQIKSQNMNLDKFVDELKTRLFKEENRRREIENTELWFDEPACNPDVFISYSRADSKIVQQLYDVLTAKGIVVWYDKKNLGVGANFMLEIRDAIRSCKLFVPVLSKNLIRQAADEHVYRKEWIYAVEHKKMTSPKVPYIIPLCEKDFDINNDLVGIESEIIIAHNVARYSEGGLISDLERFAGVINGKLSEIVELKNRIRKTNGRK